MKAEHLRLVAGLAVVAVLIAVGVAVVPPYVANMKFQSYVETLVDTAQPPESMQTAAVNKAAQLGLPVRAGDVRVVKVGNAVRIDIVYVVRVDFPLYTVDLHFHPAAGT